MQVVLLAAGSSSRFYPFSNFYHKSLVSLLGKTIIEHTLISIKKAGMTNVVIVVGDKKPFEEILGNGEKLGLAIRYALLEKPLGMGAALLAAQEFLEEEFFLTSAYHVDFSKFQGEMKSLQKKNSLVLLGKKNEATSAYGYMRVAGDKVIEVAEKPEKVEKEAFQIVGMYLLNKSFLQTLREVSTSHYNFEEALDSFSKTSGVFFVKTDNKTVTLKYPWDLFAIKEYLLDNLKNFISPKAKISAKALIEGNVFIEEGVQVMEGACIKGPAYIGKNVYIGSNSLLRNGCSIEEDVVIGAYMEVKNSIIMKGTTTHTGVIEDSIIGKDTKIAAGFCTANVRLDRKEIWSVVKGEKVNSLRNYLGAIVGSQTNIGVRASTMPGVIIGNNVVIGPTTTVMKNVPDSVTYYTEFKEVIEKRHE